MSDNGHGIEPAGGAVAPVDGPETGGSTAGGSWKVTLPCTRAEAEAIDDLTEWGTGWGGGPSLDPPPTLMTSEEVLDDAERWRLDAYFENEPSPRALAAIAALVPGATALPQVERLGDEDWVTMSQAGLAPLHVGRFFVHTGDAIVPEGARGFAIAAGRAFGTGHHETTSGCLAMLDALGSGGRRFDKVIDIGTGTGLLAFAAVALWPMADVTATDIDPVAIDVTRENAATNDIAIGTDIGGVSLIVADGTLDPTIVEWAPYDLVIANILAGPLVSMAPELAAIAAPHAAIVLAGLLETQRVAVVAAYEACGCTLEAIDRRGDWSVLRLAAGAERFVPAGPFDPRGRDGWALDI